LKSTRFSLASLPKNIFRIISFHWFLCSNFPEEIERSEEPDERLFVFVARKKGTDNDVDEMARQGLNTKMKERGKKGIK
jgi:hypothetical protein